MGEDVSAVKKIRKKRAPEALRAVVGEDGKVKFVPLAYEKSGKLSKAGEWLRDHPGGICKIVNMRAILK